MLTGNLQIKNSAYYAVLNLKEGGKYKQKWISTKLKTKWNKRKAETMLKDLISKYELVDFSKQNTDIKFSDYAQKWLDRKKAQSSNVRGTGIITR